MGQDTIGNGITNRKRGGVTVVTFWHDAPRQTRHRNRRGGRGVPTWHQSTSPPRRAGSPHPGHPAKPFPPPSSALCRSHVLSCCPGPLTYLRPSRDPFQHLRTHPVPGPSAPTTLKSLGGSHFVPCPRAPRQPSPAPAVPPAAAAAAPATPAQTRPL